jgi:acyl CoA:acetate/3-ketoacid CoA transferase alpha subunit/acyl CoA:acetate/3-ketoacid CoA transferase beta subunit
MNLHLTLLHSRPNALIWEIIRQFWGTDPGFTLIANGLTGPAHALVHGGLAERLVAGFCGDVFPSANPHPVYGRAVSEGRIEIEPWSMLTLQQRIRAAAEGLALAPTRSLTGSSMEANNGVVHLPDGSLAMTPLVPDLSLVHAPAADEDGNVLFSAPFGEGAYGAIAARAGALVSVERIVSRTFIQHHSHLVGIPSTYVNAITVVPFGAHPQGLSNQGLPDLEAYADDYAFQERYAEISRNPRRFTVWIESNLVGRTHEDYLRDLPSGRLHELVGRGSPDSWEVDRRVTHIPDDPPTPEERMACVTAQIVQERVAEHGYEHLLAGLGVAHLGGWLYQRRSAGGARLMAEIGLFDFEPREGESFIFHLTNVATCAATTDISTVLGSLVGSPGKGLGVLSAAQVDAAGNLNSTWVNGRYLVGSGGANDVASVASEVIVVVPHGPGRIVERLEYITSPGRAVNFLVTDVAVLRLKPTPTLVGVVDQGDGRSVDKLAEDARARLPWSVELDDQLKLYGVAGADIRQLRAFDPHRRFLGPLRGATNNERAPSAPSYEAAADTPS